MAADEAGGLVWRPRTRNGEAMKHERSSMFGPAEAACIGKLPFESYSAAAKVIQRKKGKSSAKAGRLKIYRCNYCHHWHMGGGPTV